MPQDMSDVERFFEKTYPTALPADDTDTTGIKPVYIIADTQRTVNMGAIYVTQNDNVRIIVKIQQHGKDVPLDDDYTYTISSVRKDGVSILSPPGVQTGVNEVTFNLVTQAVAVAGKVRTSVQIYNPKGRVSTLAFELNVAHDLASEYVPSENEQTLIEMVLYEAPAIIQEAKTQAERAEVAANSIDQSIVEAGEVVTTGTALFEEVKTLKTSTETVRQETEIVKNNTEQLRAGLQGEMNSLTSQLADNVQQIAESTGHGLVAGLQVSSQVSPNMTVSVGSGTAHIANGSRFAPTVNTTIPASTSDTNKPRTDIVYINSSGTISYLKGALGEPPTAGTRTYTITTNATVNDTITISGVTFTALSSGATGNQFNIGVDIPTTAINLISVLNANATINARFSATASGNTFIITEKIAAGGYNPSTATTTGALAIISGTITPSRLQVFPPAPATPTGGIVLADVKVGAGVTSITSANVIDRRTFKQNNNKITEELDDLVQISLRKLGAKTKEEDPNFDNINILKEAINQANAMKGKVKITLPKGTIKCGAAPANMPAIVGDCVWFSGQGEDVSVLELTSGTYFKFGSMSGAAYDGGFEKMTITYTTPDTTAPTIKLFYGLRQKIRQVKGSNLCNFIELGEQGVAYGIKPQGLYIENSRFDMAIGTPDITFIRANIGAVLEISNVFARVPEIPSMDINVGSPVKDNVNFLEVNGTWDTINITNLYLHQFYDGIKLLADNPNPTAQIPRDDIITTTITNCVFDYMKNSCITCHVTNTGNIAGINVLGGLFNTSHGRCFDFFSTGVTASLINVRINNAYINYAGMDAIRFSGTNIRNIQMTGVTIRAPKQKLAVDDTTSDAIWIGDAVNDFIIANCEIRNGIGEGFNLDNHPGITLKGNNQRYSVIGNKAEGYPITLPAQPTLANSSFRRQFKDNILTGGTTTRNYAGYKNSGLYVLPATDVDWYNVTPFDIEIHIYSGTVSSVKKGTQSALGRATIADSTGVSLTLRPGEYYQITYTVAPKVSYLVKQ